jgi:thiamine biosynthesis lipoprotein
LGAPPDSPGWEVKVQDPLAPHDPKKSATTVLLNNKCLSVSGNYEKFFKVRGVTYSHIMDPRTGRPVENMLSVAVIQNNRRRCARQCLLVQGVEKGKALLPLYSGSEVLFFLPDGEKAWKMVRLGSEKR